MARPNCWPRIFDWPCVALERLDRARSVSRMCWTSCSPASASANSGCAAVQRGRSHAALTGCAGFASQSPCHTISKPATTSSSSAAAMPASRRRRRPHALGARTALLTHRPETIGVMSCNPAIGGLGKGHLVREIDALDGIMARAADRAGIQFRMLNRRKGPAVRGPRAQADRKLYREAVQDLLADAGRPRRSSRERPSTSMSAMARVTACVLADGRRFAAGTVVLTTGTFLRGLIHIGETAHPGRPGRRGAVAGPVGDAGAPWLSARAAEDGHAAAARRAHDRLGGARDAGRATIRRSRSRR